MSKEDKAILSFEAKIWKSSFKDKFKDLEKTREYLTNGFKGLDVC